MEPNLQSFLFILPFTFSFYYKSEGILLMRLLSKLGNFDIGRWVVVAYVLLFGIGLIFVHLVQANFTTIEDLVEKIHEDGRIAKAALEMKPFSDYAQDSYLTTPLPVSSIVALN